MRGQDQNCTMKVFFTAAGFVVKERDDASNLQRAHGVLVTKQSTLHSLPQDFFFFFFTQGLKVFVLFF